MCGRLIMNKPSTLLDVERDIFKSPQVISLHEVFNQYGEYAQVEETNGVPKSILVRPVMNLFAGVPGNTKFKQHLTANVNSKVQISTIFREAQDLLEFQ